MGTVQLTFGSGIEANGTPYTWIRLGKEEAKFPPEVMRTITSLGNDVAAEAEGDAAVWKFLEAEFGQRYRPEERLAVIAKLREFRTQRREELMAAKEVPPVPSRVAATEEELAAARALLGIPEAPRD